MTGLIGWPAFASPAVHTCGHVPGPGLRTGYGSRILSGPDMLIGACGAITDWQHRGLKVRGAARLGQGTPRI